MTSKKMRQSTVPFLIKLLNVGSHSVAPMVVKRLISVLIALVFLSASTAHGQQSYQTRNAHGSIVDSKSSYQTRNAHGSIVDSKSCYQTRNAHGAIVQSAGCNKD